MDGNATVTFVFSREIDAVKLGREENVELFKDGGAIRQRFFAKFSAGRDWDEKRKCA